MELTKQETSGYRIFKDGEPHSFVGVEERTAESDQVIAGQVEAMELADLGREYSFRWEGDTFDVSPLPSLELVSIDSQASYFEVPEEVVGIIDLDTREILETELILRVLNGEGKKIGAVNSENKVVAVLS